MQKYGLIGYPLKHSFSIGYFNEKFKAENIDAEYVNFEIPRIEDFMEVIEENSNLCGLNVTIPYKEQVIPYLDELDKDTAKIGAVNVIKIIRLPKGKVKLIGCNSDIIGFTQSIEPLLQESADSGYRRCFQSRIPRSGELRNRKRIRVTHQKGQQLPHLRGTVSGDYGRIYGHSQLYACRHVPQSGLLPEHSIRRAYPQPFALRFVIQSKRNTLHEERQSTRGCHQEWTRNAAVTSLCCMGNLEQIT